MLRIQDVKTNFEPSLIWRISSELDEEYRRTRLNEGDIVFSVVGTLGEVKEIDSKLAGANISRAFAVIGADKEKICLSYLLQFLKGSQVSDWVAQTGRGGAQKVVNLGELRALSVPLPPLNEQHSIAEILSSVDASIQATQAVIEQAERVKRGLMEELLTSGLGSEAIERGEVPEGWRRTTIGALCKVVTGKTPSTKKEEYWNGDVPFFSPADLSEVATVDSAERTITREALAAGAKLLPANSILYTCIGSTIGKVAIATVECCTNQQINACLVNEGVDYRFLYFQLLMAESVVKSLSSTTAVPIINKTAFSSIEIVLPAAEEQHRIAEKLASFDSVIEKERAIIEQLTHAKSGLMDDLLTGKVRTI
jgi:type I restriction enzyme S subunit